MKTFTDSMVNDLAELLIGTAMSLDNGIVKILEEDDASLDNLTREQCDLLDSKVMNCNWCNWWSATEDGGTVGGDWVCFECKGSDEREDDD